MATLVYQIQAARLIGNAGALLLFNISGFFNNLDPVRAMAIMKNLGFPTNVCDWTTSFLVTYTVTLYAGHYTSTLFEVLNGTPQGSLLSLILSILYIGFLLEAVKA